MLNTKQEIFDHVSKALLAQSGPSMDKNGFCLYRGPEARKCGIGHLIPDEEYSGSFEGRDVVLLMKHRGGPPSLEPMFKKHSELLQDLQNAHDSAAGLHAGHEVPWVKAMTDALTYTANKFKLELNHADQ